MADLTEYKCFKNSKYQVLTNDGFRDFKGLMVGRNPSKIKLTLSGDRELVCTPKHKLLARGGEIVYAEDLVIADKLYGDIEVIDINTYTDNRKVYELLEVEKTHTYYANGVLSHQCLVIDEMAFIECVAGDTEVVLKSKITDEIFTGSVSSIVSGKNNNTIISYPSGEDVERFIPNDEWKIETDEGWKDFKGIAEYSKKRIFQVVLDNGDYIHVSKNHGFIDAAGDVVLACDSIGHKIKTVDDLCEVVDIVDTGREEKVYDFVEVEKTHKYYTNGILSHNTHLVEEFWKSVFPVITSSKKSKVFVCSTANGTDNLFYKLYSGAEAGENGWAYDRIMWNEVPGRDETWAQNTRQAIGSYEAWRQEFCSCSEDTLVAIEGRGDMQLIDVFNEMEEMK